MRTQWKRQEGSALIWALVLFVILSVTATSIFAISQQDRKEAKILEENIALKYIALAGIDIAYAALMSDHQNGVLMDYVIDGSYSTLNYSYPLAEGVDVKGTADITVDLISEDGLVWVRIVSIGSIPKSVRTHSSFLKINAANWNDMVQKQ